MDCPNPWDDPVTALRLSRFNFWFGGVVQIAVASVGVVGNAVTIAIFTLRDMRRFNIRYSFMLSNLIMEPSDYSIFNERAKISRFNRS